MSRMEFLHISDVHFQKNYSPFANRLINRTGADFTQRFRENMAHILERFPALDFALLSGDVAHEGSAEEYAGFLRLWNETCDLPLYAVPGNHDTDDIAALIPFAAVPRFDYVIEKGDLRIIGMDARGGQFGSGKLTEKQLAWLEEQLADGRESVLMLHQTPHISGEVEYLTWQTENPHMIYNSVKNTNLLGIFCGHTHKWFESFLGEIPCYTVDSITHGICATVEALTISNRTGFNHCVYENGRLTVTHHEIPTENIVEIIVQYDELTSEKGGEPC